MINKIINYHYRKYEQAVQERNADAINHAWLFIKSVLCEAYGLKEDEYRNDYSRLINACIHDERLNTDIQNIRKARNQYQHANEIELLIESDYIELCKAIESFIRYINSTNRRGFRWKYDSAVKKILNSASSDINKGQEEQNVETDKGFYFQSEGQRTQEKTSSIFMESMSIRRNVCYPIAYADSNLSLVVNETIPEVNKHPLWSVIHNLLVRGKTISESKYLKNIGLQEWELERVYVYEILLLRFLCSSFFDVQRSILVSDTDKKFIQIAYDDIQNYYWMLNRMCGYSEIMPSIRPSSNVDKFSLSDGKNAVRGYLVQRTDELAPILLSSHLEYKIDATNVDCYQVLLQEIFGFDMFKEGQLAAIKSILQNQNNTLVVLPTGYGKSLIYQFLAYLQPQITFIISPTKTLIMDQLLNLREMSVTNVVAVNNDMLSSTREEKRFFSLLVYVEPVYLEGENFFSLVNRLYDQKIFNFIAIDECHQISVWGHKFEAEYFTLLHQLICEWPDIQLLMFSATSSKRIKEDLLKQFRNKEVNVVQPCPLERENIEYHFYQKGTFLEICDAVKDVYVSSYRTGNLYDVSDINEEPSLSLIICNSKKGRETLASCLYLCDEIREVCDVFEGEKRKYDNFRNGQIRILITDDEYLSGINIPFLRNVIIVGYPPSKEWLYQESGRVGRYGEKSNVDIYTALDSEALLEELLKEEYSNSMSKKWETICNKYQDLSNLEFLYSLLFDDECISRSQKSVNEISNFLYVRENAKYGTLLGKMKKQEKKQYDYALFLLFYLRIIEKWLFIDMNSILEYRFYINLRYVDGPDYFAGLLKSKVNTESANEKIKEKFSQIPINSFAELVEITGKWISENGYRIRRQMYVNTYQLIKEGERMPSDEVEENLASYFGVGTSLPKDLPKQHSSADLARMYKVSRKGKSIITKSKEYKESEKNNVVTVKPEKRKESNENKVDIIKLAEEGEVREENNCPAIKVDKCNEKVKNVSSDKSEQIILEQHKTTSNALEESESGEKYALIDFCREKKSISWTTLSYMYSLIKKTIEEKSVHHVRGGLEREIEYEDNMVCQFALMIFELIMDSSLKYFRLQDIMNQNPLFEMDAVLKLVQADLGFRAKERINEILRENGKKAYYYRGFFGGISKWRDKMHDKRKRVR